MVRVFALLLALVCAACFEPSLEGVACGPGSACPPGLHCDHDGVCRRMPEGPPDASVADAPDAPDPDAAIDARFDAADASGCPLRFLDGCDEGGSTGDWTIAGNEVLDTDTDPRCTIISQGGGDDACLVHVGTFTVAAGGSLRAVGSRPLVVLADGDVTIGGLLDVSSDRGGEPGAGANHATCDEGSPPDDDRGGAGGGAGGSFADAGGDGGEGDSDDSLGFDGTGAGGTPGVAATTPAVVRGGCPGGAGGDEDGGNGVGGAGGASGGAVFVAALGDLEVTATGVLRATGAGGEGGGSQSGGGGGGSGGMIGLEAASLVIEGPVSANGGGGGGGGAFIGGSPTSGDPGEDGTLGLTGAAGGAGTTSTPGEGDGGDGSAGAATMGGAGLSSRSGGGGGGGSAGYVVVVGGHAGTGTITPPATVVTP